MAYNPIATGNVLMGEAYVYKVDKLSGGCTSNEDTSGDGYVCEMKDMYSDGAKIRSRGAFCQIDDSVEGEFTAKYPEEFCGNIIFHAGTSIYRFDGEKIHLLCENVGDRGFFLRMNAKLYFYSSAEKIFETDKEFNCTEAKPHIPNIINANGKGLTEYDSDEPFNMLTRRIKCTYTLSSNVDAGITQIIKIPYPPDLNEKVRISVNGKNRNIKSVSYNAEEKRITISLEASLPEGNIIVLEYAVSKEEETVKEYIEKIYGSTIAFSYGGTTKDGTRAFITGNPAYPSMYFRSELKDPLKFNDNAQETLGDASENVNGAEKRYEKMYFFTDKHIYSMTYSFSEDEGAVFTVTPVNTGVGCSMQGSVKALDNTVVFADKTQGVHILQSTDIFDELNILPISANLKKETLLPFGKQGKYFSCDFDRKYYICNGSAVYMWDYGRVPFFSGSEYRTSQEKLPWFKLCDAGEFCDMFSLGGKLYFVGGVGKCSIFEYLEDSCEDTSLNEEGHTEKHEISYSFTTKKYDFGESLSEKRLLNFSFDYENKCEKEREIILSFYGDGEIFATAKVNVKKKEGRVLVRVPGYYAGKYSVKMSFCGGGMGIDKLAFTWRKAERVKFYN